MRNAPQTRLLPVVIVALGAFAALRAGDIWFGFSEANAGDQTPGVLFADPGDRQEPLEGLSVTAPQEAEPPEIAPGEVERRILETLSARREALDAREEALDAREAIIAAAEKKLHDSAAEYRRERDQLNALREKQAEKATEEMAALVSAYEKMKARDAAAIFNELDEDILVPVSAGMRAQTLAGVLAEMQPDKARQLTRLLAERNRSDKEIQ